MARLRLLLWLLPTGLYAAFWYWYTPLGGPLTSAEIDGYAATMLANGNDPQRVAELRRFLEADTGGQFIMVNLLDMAEAPPALPDAPAGASAEVLMGLYMEHMYPALFRRACHPVFLGEAVFTAMDVLGIEGARQWTTAALMRYRSRRDLMDIVTNPAFLGRHEFKLAALDKTVAFPVVPRIYLSDPRLLLALLLLTAVFLVDAVAFRRRRSTRA